jgi:hypothetical protein
MTVFNMRQSGRGAGPHIFRLAACSENQNRGHELEWQFDHH